MGDDAIRLVRSAPHFPVVDIDRVVTHYQEVLGSGRSISAASPWNSRS